jgi:hypothetical protein
MLAPDASITTCRETCGDGKDYAKN